MADDDPVATLLRASPLTTEQRRTLWQAFEDAPDADALASVLTPMGIPSHVKKQLWDLKETSAPVMAPQTTDAKVMVNGQPMGIDDYNETQQTPERTWLDTAKDVGAGFAKMGAKGVQFAADDVPHFFGGMGASDYIDAATGRPEGESYRRVSEGATLTNIPQMVGAGLNVAAGAAFPVGAGVAAIPSKARAGAKFEEVMQAARHIPVDVSQPGNVALRIAELAQHGSGTNWGPAPVRQFIQYVTDPKKPAMTYEVARDFASNISRLSANEMAKIPPAMMRHIAELRVTLNKAVGEAAGKAGKSKEYAEAMNEFARASRLRDQIEAAIAGAKKAAPWGLGAGVATGVTYNLGKKLAQLWGGE